MFPCGYGMIERSRFNYVRHFTGLAVVSAVLLVAGRAYRPGGAVYSVALCCLLYASVTAMTVRGQHAVRHRLLFIAAAVTLGCLSFSLSFYVGRFLGWAAPIQYLVSCAGVGAIGYALVLRRAFFADLSLRVRLLAPLVSVLAVLAVFVSGLYSRNIDLLAVAWWFAFSAALCCEDYRIANAVPRALSSG